MSPTVVLLHAMGVSRRMWRAQLDELAPRYDLVAPDLPGHGHAPGPFTLDAAVAKVRAALADAPAPAYLVGASLGAAVAIQATLAEPSRVAGLLLTGAPVRMSHANVLVQRMITAVLPLATTASMSARLVRPADSGDADAFVADIVRAGKRTQTEALRELVGADPVPRLPEIAVPTLVCCGSEDKANLPSARLLADLIPGARLRIIPGGGHLWNLQRPDLCTGIIDDFVAGVCD